MFRISACYGHPTDPMAFDAHYDTTHTPLVLKVPGLAGITTGKCRSLEAGQEAPYYMVAGLLFNTADDLDAALASPEMAAASADVANFATGGMTVYITEEITRA